VVLGALVTTTVVGLMLAIPVISGVGAPAVELDSSSTTSPPKEGNPPVIMGMDGRPVESAAVGTSSSAPEFSPSEASPVAPAAPAEEPAADPAPEAPSPLPAGTPSSGGTTSAPAGPPSSTTPRQPTSSAPSPAPAPTSERPAESPAEVPDPAAEVLALVNAERAALGCADLVANPGLATAAQEHSRGRGAGPGPGLDELPGAVAQGPDAASVVAGWIADASGAPLLDCSRTSVGIAEVDGWWTALVA